ncbi:hypothetical protein BD414DRAFT_1389 [Trametes punicea]|nr:hypothetical protein BD414DRAFT_1389 [Trametes punicea]
MYCTLIAGPLANRLIHIATSSKFLLACLFRPLLPSPWMFRTAWSDSFTALAGHVYRAQSTDLCLPPAMLCALLAVSRQPSHDKNLTPPPLAEVDGAATAKDLVVAYCNPRLSVLITIAGPTGRTPPRMNHTNDSTACSGISVQSISMPRKVVNTVGTLLTTNGSAYGHPEFMLLRLTNLAHRHPSIPRTTCHCCRAPDLSKVLHDLQGVDLRFTFD